MLSEAVNSNGSRNSVKSATSSITRLLRIVATSSASCSLALAACRDETPAEIPTPLNSPPRDAATDLDTPALLDGRARIDAHDDEPTDAGIDVAICRSYGPMLCDFGAICPPYSAIGIRPPGLSGIQHDGGLDGSPSFVAYAPSGGSGFFGMPFQPLPDSGALPPAIDMCNVRCEANIRFESAHRVAVAVIFGVEMDFDFGTTDGGYVHSSINPPKTESHPGAVTDEWFHVSVTKTHKPTGIESRLTLRLPDGQASTTVVPITKTGLSMRFGVNAAPNSDPVRVFVDDVICQLTD